jgi:hypothetical protein
MFILSQRSNQPQPTFLLLLLFLIYQGFGLINPSSGRHIQEQANSTQLYGMAFSFKNTDKNFYFILFYFILFL